MEKTNADIVLAIIISSIILVILAVFTTLFFLVFVRKKKILNKNKEELSRNFEKQLLQTKLEIQDQTLNNISQEIHDNIGQVLSFIKLSLSTTESLTEKEKNVKIKECIQLIAGAINDLRDLSKSLSFEKIKNEGLSQVIKEEVQRLNRSGIIKAKFKLNGTPFIVPPQTNLILYRIFQEIVNNTLKHAQSKELLIDLEYTVNSLTLSITDKGKGFEYQQLSNKKGLGLTNITQRSALIGASISIETKPGMGCKTVLTLQNPAINVSPK